MHAAKQHSNGRVVSPRAIVAALAVSLVISRFMVRWHQSTFLPRGVTRTMRGATGATIFLFKVLPILPSGFLDRVTSQPVVGRLQYPSRQGMVEGDLYRPASKGPHPGMVVCLGVVPFGVDHPQVPRLGEALARSGFAALLHWSPAMRDLRLDVDDVENIALAYDHLLQQPGIDPARSGLLGTCVGGSFVLMAAAHPLVRDRVAFVAAFAPFAQLRTFAQDIASASCVRSLTREPWAVDQLTRNVFVRTMTADLMPDDAQRLRSLLTDPHCKVDLESLSPEARVVFPLLTCLTPEQACDALEGLPADRQTLLEAMSPLSCIANVSAPVITIMHDRDDQVIPISESRQLERALKGRAGVRHTEFNMFQHADPTQRKLRPWRLLWELGKFYRAVVPVFRQAAAVASPDRSTRQVISALPRTVGD